jgi:hypothetical protein
LFPYSVDRSFFLAARSVYCCFCVRGIKYSEVPDAQVGDGSLLGKNIGVLDHAEQQTRMQNNNARVGWL